MEEPEQKFQVLPPLSAEEYTALQEDIAEHGVRVPIVEDSEGTIIDGYHRRRAWQELRDEGYDVPDYPREVRSDLDTDAEKRELAWRLNMQRRHLSAEDKRNVVKAKLIETPHWSNNRIAKLLGVSDHTVLSARIRLEATSQIAKFDYLVGEDGKKRPRSHELLKPEEQHERLEVLVLEEELPQETPTHFEIIEQPREAREEPDAKTIPVGRMPYSEPSAQPLGRDGMEEDRAKEFILRCQESLKGTAPEDVALLGASEEELMRYEELATYMTELVAAARRR